MDNFIKWTGSKRLQSNFIITKIPYNIDTYYEPLLGSGSIMLNLLNNKNYHINHIIVSDMCEPLIGLWNEVKNNPIKICEIYHNLHYNLINSKNKKEYYNEIRNEFNHNKKLYGHFLFLTRTCINGLIRFNSHGDFNSPFHLNRNGIKPEKLSNIILNTNKLIQNVKFICQEYDKISPLKNDFVYFDPPYANTHKNMYYGGIDIDNLYKMLYKLKCKWLLSFDGKINDETVYTIPESLYKHHYYSNKSISPFRKLKFDSMTVIRDSLYANY